MTTKKTDYIAGIPWKSLDDGLFEKLLKEKELQKTFIEIKNLSKKIQENVKEMGKNKLIISKD
jgi:hypothetical protein